MEEPDITLTKNSHALNHRVGFMMFQALSGHKSSKTTDRYTNVSNRTLAKIYPVGFKSLGNGAELTQCISYGVNSPLDHFLNRNNNDNNNLKTNA